MPRVAKLICVEGDGNHNKFYDMTENADGSITSVWGRVDVTSTTTHYPVGKKKWETLLKSKIRKGYFDVTSLRATTATKADFSDLGNTPVAALVKELQGYANKSVSENYTISAEAVTPQMIDAAQVIMNDLVPLITVGQSTKEVNDKFLEMYRIIPRKMKNVRFHILDTKTITKENLADAQKLLANEQATLDVMQGQVGVSTAQKKNDPKKSQTILDAVGISIEVPTGEEIEKIKKLLGQNQHQFKKAFRVVNLRTQEGFDRCINRSANKNSVGLWHGSRNENWWSILGSGLVLRPTNAIISGKMFGYGLYAANKSQKSIGYTSLRGSYWAGGSSSKGILAIFEFHTGNQYHAKQHESWMNSLTYAALRKIGDYDSMYAHGGADLRNDEFIVYKEDQTTIKYLVEIG